MFKQIFNKSNGRPKLIQSIFDDETGIERFVYDESKYTEEMPSSELYEPISYKNGKWQGISYDEWLYNRSIDEDVEESEYEPTETDITIAETQMQLAKITNKMNEFENEHAQLILELAKKESRIQDLEFDQAQAIMEIAKLKGE